MSPGQLSSRRAPYPDDARCGAARCDGVRFDPGEEIATTVSDGSARADERRPFTLGAPSLQRSGGQPEQLRRMDFGHQSVEIDCRPCAWHRCAPTIYGRSIFDRTIASARWTTAPKAGHYGTVILGWVPAC